MTKQLNETITQLEALDKARTQGKCHTSRSRCDGDELISVDAEDRHISLHMIEPEKAMEDVMNAKFSASAPTMMQVIRKLKAKCDEQERLLDVAIEFVAEITLALGKYPEVNGTQVVADAYKTLTQLQARGK